MYSFGLNHTHFCTSIQFPSQHSTQTFLTTFLTPSPEAGANGAPRVRIPLRAAASSCGEITLSSLKPAARANPRSGLTPSRTWRAIVLSNRRFHRPHQLGLVSITIPGIVKSSSGWLSITHLPVIFFQISFLILFQLIAVLYTYFLAGKIFSNIGLKLPNT